MKKKDILVCAGAGILFAAAMLFCIIAQVRGVSMEPTFRDGSFVIARRRLTFCA